MLSKSLSAGVSDSILPASFGPRVAEIARLLVRRGQTLRSVAAQLKDQDPQTPLANYRVITFDADAGNESRGLAITDNEGKFSFTFYVPRTLTPGLPHRKFRLEVHAPTGDKLPNDGHVSVDPNQPIPDTVVPAFVKVPKLERPSIQKHLGGLMPDAPMKLLTHLAGDHGINTFADLRQKGGLQRLAGLPQTAPTMTRKLQSLADLDRITPDLAVSTALLQKNFDSVSAIAATPQSEFVTLVCSAGGALNELDAAKCNGSRFSPA